MEDVSWDSLCKDGTKHTINIQNIIWKEAHIPPQSTIGSNTLLALVRPALAFAGHLLGMSTAQERAMRMRMNSAPTAKTMWRVSHTYSTFTTGTWTSTNLWPRSRHFSDHPNLFIIKTCKVTGTWTRIVVKFRDTSYCFSLIFPESTT